MVAIATRILPGPPELLLASNIQICFCNRDYTPNLAGEIKEKERELKERTERQKVEKRR